MNQNILERLYAADFPKMTCVIRHDFEISEIEENGVFKGDLYKCKNCDEKHLCSDAVSLGSHCTHTTEFNYNCSNGTKVYSIPSLSDLIEACGEEFSHLAHRNEDNNWIAFSSNKYAISANKEEAVALLYLKLNETTV